MWEMIIRVATILVSLILFGTGIGASFLAYLGVGRRTSCTRFWTAYSIANQVRSLSSEVWCCSA